MSSGMKSSSSMKGSMVQSNASPSDKESETSSEFEDESPEPLDEYLDNGVVVQLQEGELIDA